MSDVWWCGIPRIVNNTSLSVYGGGGGGGGHETEFTGDVHSVIKSFYNIACTCFKVVNIMQTYCISLTDEFMERAACFCSWTLLSLPPPPSALLILVRNITNTYLSP